MGWKDWFDGIFTFEPKEKKRKMTAKVEGESGGVRVDVVDNAARFLFFGYRWCSAEIAGMAAVASSPVTLRKGKGNRDRVRRWSGSETFSLRPRVGKRKE